MINFLATAVRTLVSRRALIAVSLWLVLLPAALASTSTDNLKTHERPFSYEQEVLRPTNLGPVEGAIDPHGGIMAWRGIRYARAPVGELRWRAPRSPRPATTITPARRKPPRCFGRSGAGREDCLFLNVFRPATDAAGLPVYVWIHGGANRNGAAPDLSYFAAEANVVAVSIQYRLGPLGFFLLDALSAVHPDDGSGNYGILDQLLALQWVQDNIAAFGGNPDNVTVAGESAGATNVLSLMMSPRSPGLFHKAIYQSGSIRAPMRAGRAREVAATFVKNLALDPNSPNLASELRRLSPQRLFDASPQGFSFYIADGDVVPDSFHCQIKRGDYHRVPILLGGNRNEYSVSALTDAGYAEKWSPLWATVATGEQQQSIDELLSEDEQKEWTFVSSLLSDFWQAGAVHSVARALRAQQVDVWVYDFRWGGAKGTDAEFVFGAAHANEIAYFHSAGEFDIFSRKATITRETEAARTALAASMTEYYARFLHTGDPNGGRNTVKWQRWSNAPSGVKTLNLDASSEPGSDELLLFMTEREYLLDELHATVDSVADDALRAYLRQEISTRTWTNPLCPD